MSRVTIIITQLLLRPALDCLQQAAQESKGKASGVLCLSAVRLLRRLQEYGDLLRCCASLRPGQINSSRKGWPQAGPFSIQAKLAIEGQTRRLQPGIHNSLLDALTRRLSSVHAGPEGFVD